MACVIPGHHIVDVLAGHMYSYRERLSGKRRTTRIKERRWETMNIEHIKIPPNISRTWCSERFVPIYDIHTNREAIHVHVAWESRILLNLKIVGPDLCMQIHVCMSLFCVPPVSLFLLLFVGSFCMLRNIGSSLISIAWDNQTSVMNPGSHSRCVKDPLNNIWVEWCLT